MGKAKKKPRAQVLYAEPTPEQYGKGHFARLTLAYRRIPVIDTMAQTGKITPRQHYGLSRYREIAGQEDRSPMRDSLDKALHGRSNGQGIPLSAMRATHELDRLDHALGTFRAIARAIAVDDHTVSHWAATQGGTTATGAPKRSWLETCMAEIQTAANKLADAIGA